MTKNLKSHDISVSLKARVYNSSGQLKSENIYGTKPADSSIFAGEQKFPLRSPTLNFWENVSNAFENNASAVPALRAMYPDTAQDRLCGIVAGSGTSAVATSDTTLQTNIPHSDTGLEFGANSVMEQGTTTTNGASWTEKSTGGHARQNKAGFDVNTITNTAGDTWRYTFNGSPDLSTAIVGEVVVFTGATNAGNNGTFVTTAVNDGSDYIEITNASGVAEASDSPCAATIRIDAWCGRKNFGSCVFDNKMWIMGGNDTGLNDVWSSTDGITWVEVTNHANWSARSLMACIVFDNKMWVMGGYVHPSKVNDVWSSTDGITWTNVGATGHWSGRYGPTSIVFDNKMWVMGGYASSNFNDVWSSTDGVTWTNVGATGHWSARRGHTSIVFDNKMWILGGHGSAYYNDVWYSTDGANWTEATSSASWSVRYSHTSLVFDNKMWVMGGATGSAYNDVWTAEEALMVGVKRTFTNKAVADLTINELGIKTGEKADYSGSLVSVRDLVPFVCKQNKPTTISYKIATDISSTIMNHKNWFQALLSGLSGQKQDLADINGTDHNINAFSASNDMNAQGTSADVTKGLVIGSGGAVAYDQDDITLIPHSSCNVSAQTYASANAVGNKSSIEFERTFTNVSGSSVSVTQASLRSSDGTNSYTMVIATISETLADGDWLVLTLNKGSEV